MKTILDHFQEIVHDNPGKDGEEDYLTEEEVIMDGMEHIFNRNDRQKHGDENNKAEQEH